ncbi:MAG: hypothetical protein IPN13_17150 [Bacteroidetes bacterium]|nr:hypothetical protein [Bacteroidota bacterium]
MVEEGVTLGGNYDLFSIPYPTAYGGTTINTATSPNGTMITTTKRGKVISKCYRRKDICFI